jgi:luciferase-like monooxygenase
MPSRIGLSVMPLETRHEAIVGLATEGDRLGYDGFFMPETWGYDMTVLLADAAARTTRITLGTGIVGIWNRSAATIAMAAATLHAHRAAASRWASAPARRNSRRACTTRRSSRRCPACAG